MSLHGGVQGRKTTGNVNIYTNTNQSKQRAMLTSIQIQISQNIGISNYF